MRAPAWILKVNTSDYEIMREVQQGLISNLPLSQNELANELDLGQSTVQRWAAGERMPSNDQLKAIAEVVATRIEQLEAGRNAILSFTDAFDHAVKTKGRKNIHARKALHETLEMLSKQQRRLKRQRKAKSKKRST